MRAPKFKVVSIDLRETLVGYRHPPHVEYRRAAEMVGAPNTIQKEDLYTAMKAVRNEWPNYGHKQGIPAKTWWTQVISKTFSNANIILPPEKFNQIADALFDLYKGSAWSLELSHF
jgi:hypothetical protein